MRGHEPLSVKIKNNGITLLKYQYSDALVAVQRLDV